MANPTVNDAYRHLDIDRTLVSKLPRITPQLGQVNKMLDKLGLNLPHDPYFYLSASEHPDARAILDARNSLPRYMANLLPIEAFCCKAGISPPRVLEMITVVAMRMGAQASTMLAALSHPEVVKRTIESALTDAGADERAILHKATGFLPTPKGAQTQISIPVNVSAASAATSTAQAASVSAPSPDNTIRRLSERLNLRPAVSQPALPVSSATELPDDEPIEPELVHVRDLASEGEEADDIT